MQAERQVWMIGLLPLLIVMMSLTPCQLESHLHPYPMPYSPRDGP